MPDDSPAEVLPSEAERIAFAYHSAAQGNAWDALVQAIEDAIADSEDAERRLREREGLISHGYARGRVGAACR